MNHHPDSELREVASRNPLLHSIVRCPACRSPLEATLNELLCQCASCRTQYPIISGIPVLIAESHSLFKTSDFRQGRVTTFKKQSWLKRRLRRWLPRLGLNINTAANFAAFREELLKLSDHPRLLIIGGSIAGYGVNILSQDGQIELVETDVAFGPRTQYIADVHSLPFADASFDGVLIQAVLQCVIEPTCAVAEIQRVLKTGGIVYTEISFLQQVVNGCYDFNRWTHLGMIRLFHEFNEIRSGVVAGPATALAWCIRSFFWSMSKSKVWQGAVTVGCSMTLFWLKWLDYWLASKPGAYDAASGYFFLGRKRDEPPVTDQEVITRYRGIR